MLFLLRPRQTWMPYALPRSAEQQRAYNAQLQQAYASTRRVAPPDLGQPTGSRRDPLAELKDLGELHRSGVLTDDEFTAAKRRILDAPDGTA